MGGEVAIATVKSIPKTQEVGERRDIAVIRTLIEEYFDVINKRLEISGAFQQTLKLRLGELSEYPDSLKKSPSMNFDSLVFDLKSRFKEAQETREFLLQEKKDLEDRFFKIAHRLKSGKEDSDQVLKVVTGRNNIDWQRKTGEYLRAADREKWILERFSESTKSAENIEAYLDLIPLEKGVAFAGKLASPLAKKVAAWSGSKAESLIAAGGPFIDDAAKQLGSALDAVKKGASKSADDFSKWINQRLPSSDDWDLSPATSGGSSQGVRSYEVQFPDSPRVAQMATKNPLSGSDANLKAIGEELSRLGEGLCFPSLGSLPQNPTVADVLDSIPLELRPMEEFKLLVKHLSLKPTGRRAMGGDSIVIELEGNKVLKFSWELESRGDLGKRFFDCPLLDTGSAKFSLPGRTEVEVNYLVQPLAVMDVTQKELVEFTRKLKASGYEWADNETTGQLGRVNGEIKLLDYYAVQKKGDSLKQRVARVRDLYYEAAFDSKMDAEEVIYRLLRDKNPEFARIEITFKRFFDETFRNIGRKEFFDILLPKLKEKNQDQKLFYRAAMRVLDEASAKKSKEVADFFRNYTPK
jgi:hypothetical protein